MVNVSRASLGGMRSKGDKQRSGDQSNSKVLGWELDDVVDVLMKRKKGGGV